MLIEQPQRRPRSDKGRVQATERDHECITWIAEMYAVCVDQVQQLLSRNVDPAHPFKNGHLIGQTTMRDLLARWKRAGWIVQKKMLLDSPAWVTVTQEGLVEVDLHESFKVRPVSGRSLKHIYAVNQVRLWAEEQEYEWISERSIRAGLKRAFGQSSGPIPDGLMDGGGEKVAVEVQITPLGLQDYAKKISALLEAYEQQEVSRFPSIWFFVPTEGMKKTIEKERQSLEKGKRCRVKVLVREDLLINEDQLG